jgi:hypothetical protein
MPRSLMLERKTEKNSDISLPMGNGLELSLGNVLSEDAN